MRTTIFLLFCLLGLLSACATGPTTSVVWTKAGVQAQQKAIDTQICTANGYQVAGPRPVPQAAPACGFAQGSVAASNGAAMGSWKAAFQSGFESCMYDKGYFQTTITN